MMLPPSAVGAREPLLNIIFIGGCPSCNGLDGQFLCKETPQQCGDCSKCNGMCVTCAFYKYQGYNGPGYNNNGKRFISKVYADTAKLCSMCGLIYRRMYDWAMRNIDNEEVIIECENDDSFDEENGSGVHEYHITIE
jgi:hypothetical protein